MSTIVFRDGIMAADSRAYSGGNNQVGSKVKTRLIDNHLIGVSCTTAGVAERFFRAFDKGFIVDDYGLFLEFPPDGELGRYNVLVVDKDWNAYVADDSLHFSGPIRADFYAIGSGSHYAIGAMEQGACAVDAIRVAAKMDVWSGLPIDCKKHCGYSWRLTA